jgi:hypothetical protein
MRPKNYKTEKSVGSSHHTHLFVTFTFYYELIFLFKIGPVLPLKDFDIYLVMRKDVTINKLTN